MGAGVQNGQPTGKRVALANAARSPPSKSHVLLTWMDPARRSRCKVTPTKVAPPKVAPPWVSGALGARRWAHLGLGLFLSAPSGRIVR